MNDGGMVDGGWLICIRVWVGGQGVGIISVFFIFICAFVFWSLMSCVVFK